MKPFDKLQKQIYSVRSEINELTRLFPGSGPLLGDLARAIDAFDSRRTAFPEMFSDVKERPDRQTRRIANAEANLAKQKALLSQLKDRKRYALAHPGRAEVVPVEAVDAQQERVTIAERQLAKTKGMTEQYQAAQKATAQAQAAKDLKESADGISAWQAGWRDKSWINPNWRPEK